MKFRVVASHSYGEVSYAVQRKVWWWEDVGVGSFTSEQAAIRFADEGIVRWETRPPKPIGGNTRWGSYQ